MASVRDPAALARLPDAERQQWQGLWADLAAVIAADPVEKAQDHAKRREWGKAAECYARALNRRPGEDGYIFDSQIWFEYAAVSLLGGDRPRYAKACAHMVERCGKTENMRPYLVARACTLAPDAVEEPSLPARLAAEELEASPQEPWSLTEQGALAYRAGRYQLAVELFERSLRAEPKPGQAVLNWLRLALAQERRGNRAEARRWLEKAAAWLGPFRRGLPARAEEDFGLHLHNWLEAEILRREAEAMIGQTTPH